MSISAVSGVSNFSQLNRQVFSRGSSAAGKLASEASSYYRVSNFGTETKYGHSKFIQSNNNVDSLGTQKTQMLTDRAQANYEVSNFGNETKYGHSKFIQGNGRVLNDGEHLMQTAMQQATKAYAQAASKIPSTLSKFDISA